MTLDWKNFGVKQFKKAQTSKKQNIVSREVAEKDTEETVMLQDSEETITDISKCPQKFKIQEIIRISSDSEI